MKISIADKAGKLLASAEGEASAGLVYGKRYHKGDTVLFEADEGFYTVKLDDALDTAVIFVKTALAVPVPFGSEKFGHNPKAYSGKKHVLYAKRAGEEAFITRDLCFNPYDSHMSKAFPHAEASTETRGSSMFAARNAIDGNVQNRSHGFWPYESWGINKDPEAALTVYFGCTAEISEAVLYCRADFPHDSFWTEAELLFSNGFTEKLALRKTAEPQSFAFPAQKAEWVKLHKLIKNKTDPSEFPALSELLIYGKAIKKYNNR